MQTKYNLVSITNYQVYELANDIILIRKLKVNNIENIRRDTSNFVDRLKDMYNDIINTHSGIGPIPIFLLEI